MSPSSIASLIDSYLEGPVRLRQIVSGLTASQLEARPIAGKWSTREVVGHLVDSEQAWCHRMKRVIAEERPLLIGYDESRFTTSLQYHQHELESELALLEAMRRQMAVILRSVPEAAWARVGVHSERGLITLAEMLKTEVDHVFHHIDQIVEKRQALNVPAAANR